MQYDNFVADKKEKIREQKRGHSEVETRLTAESRHHKRAATSATKSSA